MKNKIIKTANMLRISDTFCNVREYSWVKRFIEILLSLSCNSFDSLIHRIKKFMWKITSKTVRAENACRQLLSFQEKNMYLFVVHLCSCYHPQAHTRTFEKLGVRKQKILHKALAGLWNGHPSVKCSIMISVIIKTTNVFSCPAPTCTAVVFLFTDLIMQNCSLVDWMDTWHTRCFFRNWSSCCWSFPLNSGAIVSLTFEKPWKQNVLPLLCTDYSVGL